jgi:hypothetical protein
MSTRAAVISSVVWVVLVVAGGLAVVSTFSRSPFRGARATERAAKLGGGLGVVAGIGVSGIWGVWLIRRKSRDRAGPAVRRPRRPNPDRAP